MTARSISRPARARGALLGALAAGGHQPFLEILADELAEGRTDLRRLAERWVAWHHAHPGMADADTSAALDFLAAHGAPPSEGGRGSGGLVHALPVALVAFKSPRTLVSATVHIAALTHPHGAASWGAVAINVALGALLDSRRDFIPDVIEALAGNAAPPELLAAARQVPRGPRRALPEPAAVADDAVLGVVLAFELAYHEPLAPRGFGRLLEAGPSPAAAVAGALLGARDGEAAVPRDHVDPRQAEHWAALADRLLRHAPAPA